MRAGWGRVVGPGIILAVTVWANASWSDLAAALGFAAGDMAIDAMREAAQSSVWLASAFLLMRLIDALVWQRIVPHRTGMQATRLLVDLVNGLIVITTGIAIVGFVFKQPVTGLLATSSVAVAVVGFALKSLISDLFSGIAITLDRPFHLGDWVEITGVGVGKVMNVSWRTTGLMLENGIYVLVPNGRLSEMTLKVYDRQQSGLCSQVEITLGYDVGAHQAERILLSAAADVPEVAMQENQPYVRILDFGESGTRWRLSFWVPDYSSQGRLRYAVRCNILHNLHFSGITVPARRIDSHVFPTSAATVPGDSPQAFLAKVSLFKVLASEEMVELAASSEFKLVMAGTVLVRNGTDGASLFVVKEGLFDVLIPNGTGEDKSVAHLRPGAFFGEMSLLTGAPRSATVRAVVDSMVIEITKDALHPILKRRETVVDAMSQALAERQLANDRMRSESESAADKHAEHQTLAQQLVNRIRTFFVLGNGSPGHGEQ